MTGYRKAVSTLAVAAVFAICGRLCPGQNTTKDVPPVIDVHVHAMDDISGGGADVSEYGEVHGLGPENEGSAIRLGQ